jgi:bacitracin transport system ATP-binding protein
MLSLLQFFVVDHQISANDLLQRLEEMNKSFDTTIVMVTHDPVAASFAERVIT